MRASLPEFAIEPYIIRTELLHMAITMAKRFGVTRERVRQIQVEALRRLRDLLHHQGLSIEALFQQ